MTPEEKKLIKARKLVAAVNRLAKKQGLNFFIVTDGASGISNNGNPAVRNAREAQVKWELEHGADPYEDWSKKASSKSETYESGEGVVESYTPDKTDDHDEIVLRLKNGKRIVISNNTKLGIRVIPAEGDELGYHGYQINGTNVVHKVHGNKHQRGGWLEPEKKSMRLYTYLPKENTVDTDGILATALTDDGWKKYQGRTKMKNKDAVLRILDAIEPGWKRSMAISALEQPIPEDAAEDLVQFAKGNRLYSFDLNDLINAGLVKHIREVNKKHTQEVPGITKHNIDWKRKPGKLLFTGIPHYMIETKDGKIPPELVRVEKAAMNKVAARDWEGMPGYPGGPAKDVTSVKHIATKSDVKQKGLDFDRVEPEDDVKYFFDTIIPYLKKNSTTAGKPGVDYDASKFVPGFYDSVPISYGDVSTWKDTSGAAYSSPTEGVVLGPSEFARKNPSVKVHELKHQQNNDSFGSYRKAYRFNPFKLDSWLNGAQWDHVWTPAMSGRSAADNALLTRAYGFNKSDAGGLPGYVPEYEQATTNAEYQFAIMQRLASELGRRPTPQEFKDYIVNMPSDDVVSIFNGMSPNEYQNSALRRRRSAPVEAFEKEHGKMLAAGQRSGLYPDSAYKKVRVGYDERGISPEEARKTEWYKLNPEFFENEIKRVEDSHKEFPNASYYFSPGELLDDELRTKQFDEWDKFIQDKSEYSDEDVDAIRKAWSDVAKNDNGLYGGGVTA